MAYQERWREREEEEREEGRTFLFRGIAAFSNNMSLGNS